jgi:hypothetical protein
VISFPSAADAAVASDTRTSAVVDGDGSSGGRTGAGAGAAMSVSGENGGAPAAPFSGAATGHPASPSRTASDGADDVHARWKVSTARASDAAAATAWKPMESARR